MSAPDAAPAAIRVVTWNIHGFKGDGRRPDPERTLAVIRRLDPDILALQEVDGRTRLGRLPDAFGRLGAALGGHRAEARLLGGQGREYGHLLWSRWPLSHAVVRALPGPGLEPRAAIDAVVDTPLGPVRVLAVHLGLRPSARRRQAQALAAMARECEPTLLVGDFNEWRAGGGVHRRLTEALPQSSTGRTWPSRRPVAAFDRIYAGPHWHLHVVDAGREAAHASDHRPMAADCVLLAGPIRV